MREAAISLLLCTTRQKKIESEDVVDFVCSRVEMADLTSLLSHVEKSSQKQQKSELLHELKIKVLNDRYSNLLAKK